MRTVPACSPRLRLPWPLPALLVWAGGWGLWLAAQALGVGRVPALAGAALAGVEWSPLLAWASRRRCRHARVWRGDMWAASWAGFDLVYLFQRPESMARAHAKAARELAPGAWLVSLEFAVPGQLPVACLQGPRRRPVWVYQPAATQQTSIMAPRSR